MTVAFAAPDREFPESLFIAVRHHVPESAGGFSAF